MNEKPILELKNIVKVFPGVKALKGVDLNIYPGEVHALCGENGAGKSTLMKIIAGADTYTSGEMILDGNKVSFNSTKEAEENGIVMIYQEFNLLRDLSVAENMFMGHLPSSKFGRVNWKQLNKKAKDTLEKLNLDLNPETKVRNLTIAECSMVEIAKALTVGARIIIMDEPTAALADEEMQILFSKIEELKKAGIAIIYISHRMDEIFEISDRITVFRDGHFASEMMTKDTGYEEVVSHMVGRKVDRLYPEREYEEDEVVLELQDISGNKVNNVNLKLHKGEILGITGLLGAGTIELSKIIYGAYKRSSGNIILRGKPIWNKSPKESLKEGIALISDDRKEEGLVLIRPVNENILMSSPKNYTKNSIINSNKEKQIVESQIKNLNIKVSGPDQQVNNLSGGNQQKIVFAKALESNPDVMILNEPTRGVDIGAKSEIYNIINELTKQGKSMILISTDLPEVVGLSDRVIVMREGKIVKEISKKDSNEELILAYASGGVNEE
ncbi:MAG: sugar ABC transporter ATP-binding protein [Lagierella massiliensis]|nr:sugar ABC transporter ATP-binding protein [Lagierella massiliensis]